MKEGKWKWLVNNYNYFKPTVATSTECITDLQLIIAVSQEVRPFRALNSTILSYIGIFNIKAMISATLLFHLRHIYIMLIYTAIIYLVIIILHQWLSWTRCYQLTAMAII
jgi:hypothetical protein